ncbi:MarR family winged helix-turn-helix transcriptional regulator [Parasphingorhabdus sp.]|uniref:MarR family winged helix-turn-helix transcriptional regulator n=1 Tax=Parasphingorhabdus sp. TaxID=2709688 RepID=UPI003265E060
MSASKHRLYWRLQLAAHFLKKRADKNLLSKSQVTTAQIGVLTVIVNGIDVTQKDVATALGLNESAITAMVKRLDKMKLVERRPSKTDGRAKILQLTDAGRHVTQTAHPPFKDINEQIETVLTDQEIDNLANYLNKLTDAFQ